MRATGGQDSKESCPLRYAVAFVGLYDESPCVKSIISCRVVPLVPAPLLREYRTGLLFNNATYRVLYVPLLAQAWLFLASSETKQPRPVPPLMGPGPVIVFK